MTDDQLRFLHVSDIHFRELDYDLNEEIRNEFDRDTEQIVRTRGPLAGILITGDIGFSGKVSEYSIALAWLDNLCRKLNCSPDSIWCVPGNHDVNWDVIDKSKMIRDIHDGIRIGPISSLEKRLYEYIADEKAYEVLFASIENYNNEFATKFGCEIAPDRPYVEAEFELNDNSKLKIRGINSTLISYKDDNDTDHKLIVGARHATIKRQDGVEYLLMCHHPYPWLLDYEYLNEHWSQRSKIQLFAHKHKQRLEKVDNHIVMSAGAMQPDRSEQDWVPRYNLIEINVSKSDDTRLLNINVFSRVWNKDEQEFRAEYTKNAIEYREYHLELEPWVAEPIIKQSDSNDDVCTEPTSDLIINIEQRKEQAMYPARKLAYRFLRLPFHTRINIANKLDLLEDEDKGLKEGELFQRFFQKAKQDNKLRQLWIEVETAHGNQSITDNPY